jgi:hypothetical protein
MPLAQAGPTTVEPFLAWERGRPSGRDAILQLADLNVAIPLVEVFRRIVLDD